MTTIVEATAARLKAQVGTDTLLDVGQGAADILGVPKTKLNRAVQLLQAEGYMVFYLAKQQKDTNLQTTVKVLTAPGSSFVQSFRRYSDEGGALKSVKKEVTRAEITAVGAASKELLQAVPAVRQKMIDKLNRALVLAGEGYTNAEIADAMGVKEKTIEGWFRNNRKVATLNHFSSLTLRVRELKRQGMSNVMIGKMLSVNESTVRRRLKKPLTPEEQMLERMEEKLALVRHHLMTSLVQDPLLQDIFPLGQHGEDWHFNLHTVKRRATLTPGARATFALEFSAMVVKNPKDES